MVALMPPAAAEEPDQITLQKKEGQLNLSWQMAPMNPDFVHYQEQRMDLIPETKYGDIRATGLIPSPVDLSHTKGMQVRPVSEKGMLSYPQQFDLRDHGRVSPVKDQGEEGSCWSFATYGSLESFFLPDEEWDFSENNMKNLVYRDFDSDDGGSEFMSTAYLARWSGPICEEDDPYVAGSTDSPSDLPPVKRLDTVYFLPDRSGFLDNDNIKWALTEHGAVYISLFWDVAYYNEDTSAFYTGTELSANHAVTVVGWDDTYCRTHFRSEPPGDGAFIIKNSWGTGWGDDGYFYISYYDTSLQMAVAFTAVDTTTYDRNYHYDPLGWVSNVGFGLDTAWFANIFTALSDETLTAVSFYTAAPDSAYQIFIYTDPTGGPIGPGGVKATASGTIGVPGYHIIDLSDVELSEGQDFSAVVRLTTPGFGFPIPVEDPVEGYSSKATAHPGESYVSLDGESWTDITILSENTNVCLKAFTTVSTLPEPFFSANTTSGNVPLTVAFTDESIGTPTAWFWDFGDGEMSRVPNPVHTYTEAGDYIVELTVTNSRGQNMMWMVITVDPLSSEQSHGVFRNGQWIFAEGEDWTPTPFADRPQFGQAGDVPVVVNGKPGVFRNGQWIFAEDAFWTPTPFADRPQFGQAGDVPVVVDGKPGVFRNGQWIFAEGEDWTPTPFADRPQFGQAGDIPVVVSEKPGVFRNGQWIFAEDEAWTPTPAADRRQFGQAGDVPVVVDEKPGVFRNGQWIFAEDEDWTPTPAADRKQFGQFGDRPVMGIVF